jgi:post-segregation antitoxin (ccd killing protein)
MTFFLTAYCFAEFDTEGKNLARGLQFLDPQAPRTTVAGPRRRAREGVTAMTELVVRLPDELAQRARKAGLLSDSAMQRLFEEAIRREAGRKLLTIAEGLHAAGIAPMNDEEIVAEVKATRAERRSDNLQDLKQE